MRKMTVAELALLFTANTDQVDKAEKQVLAVAKKIESKPVKVGADPKDALAGMDKVEKAAKTLVSKDTALKLDADITRVEAGVDRAKQRLEDLKVRALGGLDVAADTKRAEANLQRLERTLAGLTSARAKVEVEVDAKPDEAQSRLQRFLARFRSDAQETGDTAGKSLVSSMDSATRGAGEKVGSAVGAGVEDTLIQALAAIPIAGGIVLAGVAIGKALTDGIQDAMQIEVGFDRLEALTGISPEAALRLGRAAGEAYANNFGESIESNMDATRLALQFRILDPSATTRDAQLVVQGLAGIADVLQEDVRPVAQAVTQLLSTGMAKNAQQAYDLIAAGARNGMNRNEDLLDTLTEYPSLFQRLGLSGEEALGLINQGMQAGARNSDLAADALKEFQIRATDASTASAEGFKSLGFNAEEMTAKIARGGQEARDGLDAVLDRLRDTEDPVLRNAAAVALFGTQAEDLGQALFAMDLSTAVEQLDGVTGSAKRMFDTIADNDASKIQQAQRNIEVAADGIKGALAGAFSEPLGDLADFVSQNRGPVLQFFADLVNGAIDFGISATESFGSFVSGPLADVLEGGLGLIDVLNSFRPAWDQIDKTGLEDMVAGMRDFDDTTDGVVDKLESMRGEFNGFADAQIALGYVNDAALRTADAVAAVGLASDGTRLTIAGLDVANLAASASGRALQEQLDASAQSLLTEYDAAIRAGESQTNLKDRYDSTSASLMAQLTAMGLTQEQAQSLIDTVLQTPDEAYTRYSSNAEAEGAIVDRLTQKVVQMPDGSFVVVADTAAATSRLQELMRQIRLIPKNVTVSTNVVGQGTVLKADGGLVEFMAAGGIRGSGLTPMSPIAQVVSPNTWRVVGDRGDVDESYIPIDGSARSMSILLETMRRMGVAPMYGGGVTGQVPSAMPSLAGMVIAGRLEIGGDGLAELIDGRVVELLPSPESITSRFAR